MFLLDVPSFCSAEYWKAVLQNGFGCMLGSFLAIYISYLIYRATTAAARNDREALERANNANTRNYFFLQVRGVVNATRKQLTNFQSFLDQVAADPTEFPLVPYTAMYEVDRVSHSQTLEKALAAILSQNPNNTQVINQFANLISNIDYINIQVETQVEQFKKGQIFAHERQKKIQQLYRDILRTVNSLLSQKSFNYPQELRQVMENVMTQYTNKEGNRTIHFSVNEFIIPLEKELWKLYEKKINSEEISLLADLSSDSISTYYEMQQQIKSIAGDLETVLTDIKEKGLDKLVANATNLGIAVPEEEVQPVA